MEYRELLRQYNQTATQLRIAEQVMARIGPCPNNPVWEDEYNRALDSAIQARIDMDEINSALTEIEQEDEAA